MQLIGSCFRSQHISRSRFSEVQEKSPCSCKTPAASSLTNLCPQNKTQTPFRGLRSLRDLSLCPPCGHGLWPPDLPGASEHPASLLSETLVCTPLFPVFPPLRRRTVQSLPSSPTSSVDLGLWRSAYLWVDMPHLWMFLSVTLTLLSRDESDLSVDHSRLRSTQWRSPLFLK